MDHLDHRAELLRTQAVSACLKALTADIVNVYGTDPKEWSGAILEGDARIVCVQHFRDGQGHLQRYQTTVRVEVKRYRVDG